MAIVRRCMWPFRCVQCIFTKNEFLSSCAHNDTTCPAKKWHIFPCKRSFVITVWIFLPSEWLIAFVNRLPSHEWSGDHAIIIIIYHFNQHEFVGTVIINVICHLVETREDGTRIRTPTAPWTILRNVHTRLAHFSFSHYIFFSFFLVFLFEVTYVNRWQYHMHNALTDCRCV